VNASAGEAAVSAPAGESVRRVDSIDWERVSEELEARGNARIDRLLTPDECNALAALYPLDYIFRNRVMMERHGFGHGEYKYFRCPLPGIVAGLRSALYRYLAPTANRWNAAMGMDVRYPETHTDFIARCHAAGQYKPTPLLLNYGADDYNCLHQDPYGAHVIPLQVTILFSETERDFSGGEFVITGQRPRRQSRPKWCRGGRVDAAAVAVHERPVRGTRGVYRVNLRHGVSHVRAGRRCACGLIFHDAE